jgi:hypothetical protein
MANYRFLCAGRACVHCECRAGVRYLFLLAICVFDGCVTRASGFHLLRSLHISGFRVLSAGRACVRCECRGVSEMGYVWCAGVRCLFFFAICVFDGRVMRASGFYLLGLRHISGFRVLSAGRACVRCECRGLSEMGYVWCPGVRYLFLVAIYVSDGCVMRASGFYLLGSSHVSGVLAAQTLLSRVHKR